MGFNMKETVRWQLAMAENQARQEKKNLMTKDPVLSSSCLNIVKRQVLSSMAKMNGSPFNNTNQKPPKKKKQNRSK